MLGLGLGLGLQTAQAVAGGRRQQRLVVVQLQLLDHLLPQLGVLWRWPRDQRLQPLHQLRARLLPLLLQPSDAARHLVDLRKVRKGRHAREHLRGALRQLVALVEEAGALNARSGNNLPIRAADHVQAAQVPHEQLNPPGATQSGRAQSGRAGQRTMLPRAAQAPDPPAPP
jgi:hypothetical protein